MYLLTNCKAYLGSDSGTSQVPYIFKKPFYFVNFSSTLIHVLTDYCPFLFIFKRIKNLKNNQMLTLRDILKSNFAYTSSTYDFEKNNLEPIDNSSDDIKSLALEIEREFRNQTYMDKEDFKLQKEFW